MMLLSAQDSTIINFGRADVNGHWEMKAPGAGRYILVVTYPEYTDYTEVFSLTAAQPVHDFKNINLIPKLRLLNAVIVKGNAAAIKIKGDTTEYNASAYKIQPNAKVEDLLKQLPGLQVDKDGHITAFGQRVDKVLVDGEEFFGDDPTLVTRNIRGDMVNKVQLYDKKTDQAALTGIEDGKKIKTINVTLKEDKKNGYFGKVDAGGGNHDFYQGQAMYNLFSAKTKFAVFGNIANTGKTGLTSSQSDKFGLTTDNITFAESGILRAATTSDALESSSGRYYGQGIPEAAASGVHYDSKLNKDQETINANYKISAITVTGSNNTLLQNNLPTGALSTTANQDFNNHLFKQKADVTFQHKFNAAALIKVMVEGTQKNTEGNNVYQTAVKRTDSSLVNTSDRTLSDKGNQQIFNSNIFFSNKFKKTGRVFSLSLSQSAFQGQTRGYLNSINKFFSNQSATDSTQRVDQYKTTDLKTFVFTGNATYTEPLSSKFTVAFTYAWGMNNAKADRRSYNSNGAGLYNVLDTLYSNNYRLKQTSNLAGLIFTYKSTKSSLNYGTKVGDIRFNQSDLYTGQVYRRSFVNWYPQVIYSYRSSQQRYFNFSYTGNTQQPSIDQIQPVRTNTDPINITAGNAALKPAFNNRLSMSWNSYQVATGQSINLISEYSFVTNPIVASIVTDSAGRTLSQAVNLPGPSTNSLVLSGTFGKKIKGSNITVSLSPEFRNIRAISLSNNVINQRQVQNYQLGIIIVGSKVKSYDFYLSLTPNYTHSVSLLGGQPSDSGKGFKGDGSVTYYLPLNFQLSADFNYQYRAKTQVFNNSFSALILNSSLSKRLLKEENLRFSLSGNDLLNQNTGFIRNAYSTVISQSRFTTIKRYLMLSVIWDFNKMGSANK